MAVALEEQVLAVPRPSGGQYPAVPEGWLNYTCFGKPIKGTQIIAIKTPLKKNFHNGLLKKNCPPVIPDERYTYGISVEDEFTPAQCMERLATRCEGFKLGAVIDLTYTDRYYNKKDFIDSGVKYHKIKVPGKVIPSDSIYERFKVVVDMFLKEIEGAELLAIHCTHGLNRTGYLVCRYLTQQLHLDVKSAIKGIHSGNSGSRRWQHPALNAVSNCNTPQKFNDARGHNIEKKHYLQHLLEGCPRGKQSFRELESRGAVSEGGSSRSYPVHCRSDEDLDWRSRGRQNSISGYPNASHSYQDNGSYYGESDCYSSSTQRYYGERQPWRYQDRQAYDDWSPSNEYVRRSHYNGPQHSRRGDQNEGRHQYGYYRGNAPFRTYHAGQQGGDRRHGHRNQIGQCEVSGDRGTNRGNIRHRPRNRIWRPRR